MQDAFHRSIFIVVSSTGSVSRVADCHNASVADEDMELGSLGEVFVL